MNKDSKMVPTGVLIAFGIVQERMSLKHISKYLLKMIWKISRFACWHKKNVHKTGFAGRMLRT